MDGLKISRILLLAIGMIAASPAFAVTDIKSIGFEVRGGAGKFTIEASGPLTYTRQDYPDEKQIVLDITGAHLTKPASRQLDTSSFDSAVTMISPYQIEDEKDKVRIVIQLRESAGAQIAEGGSGLVMNIGGAPSDGSTSKSPTADAKDSSTPSADAPPDQAATDADKTDAGAGNKPEGKKEDSYLETFEKSAATKHYVGRPITLQVKDADVQDVIRLIGEASGFNVIASNGVSGKITLCLIDVPWDQVLDVVLSTMGLGAERSNNILRVMKLSELTQLKQEQMSAKAVSLQSAVRVTKIFPISYADLGALTTVLKTFGQSIAAGAGVGQTQIAPGIVQSDSRTNSLIVQDVPENIDRMKKLIEILDVQTPQVLIEAKIVEASQSVAAAIGGNLGVSFGPKGGRSVLGAGFNGAQIPNSTIGAGTAPGTAATPAATSSGTANFFSIAPSVGFLPGVQQLSALLNISEAEQTAKVISSPRVVVLHRESATIVQSQPVLIESAVISNGTVSNTKTFQSASINLSVTPTVTNDESVLLQLSVTRDIIQDAGSGQSATGNRNINTKVLVDSGSTLVVGGIYTQDSRDSEDGIPFLRKIPIIGNLFSNKSNSSNRNELFIFVTPRILNTKRAGLKST